MQTVQFCKENIFIHSKSQAWAGWLFLWEKFSLKDLKGGENKMNRKIIFSGLSIVTSLAMMAGSAFAAFTAPASSVGNTFAAGDLSLEVLPNGGAVSGPAFIVPGGFAPGNSKSQRIHLNNTGTVDSSATTLVSITHSTSTTPDLGDKLILRIYDDVSGDDTIDGLGNRVDPSVDDVVRGTAPVTSAAWSNINLGFGITASGTHQVVATVQFDPTADNSYQGADSTFDLNFQTSQ